MSDSIDLLLTCGAILVIAAVASAWIIRDARAPFSLKLALPSLMCCIACYSPFALDAMLGLPVSARLAALPERAQLLSFLPREGETLVDLWLLSGVSPRAYETELDARMKSLLRDAEILLSQGRPVYLRKDAKSAANAGSESPLADNQGAGAGYAIDEAMVTTLPTKR